MLDISLTDNWKATFSVLRSLVVNLELGWGFCVHFITLFPYHKQANPKALRQMFATLNKKSSVNFMGLYSLPLQI